jgi:hypothetical protein
MFVRHLMKLILSWPFSFPQEGILENEFPVAVNAAVKFCDSCSASSQSMRAVAVAAEITIQKSPRLVGLKAESFQWACLADIPHAVNI